MSVKRSSSFGCIGSHRWLTGRAEAGGLLCCIHYKILPGSQRGGGVFQLHSGDSLSLGVPSPSRLLRLRRLDGRCPAIGDPCRSLGLVRCQRLASLEGRMLTLLKSCRRNKTTFGPRWPCTAGDDSVYFYRMTSSIYVDRDMAAVVHLLRG